MARYDRYHPNYKQLYPGVEITPEVLDFLDKSDRKMEYAEVDLKVEGFVCDHEKKIAHFSPAGRIPMIGCWRTSSAACVAAWPCSPTARAGSSEPSILRD